MIQLSSRELKLRYDKPWKTIAYFCAPTVLLMVVQGLYNILDKSIALQFVPETIASLDQYVKWYNELKGTNVTEIPFNDLKSYINVATQYASQVFVFLFAFGVMLGFGCTLAFSIAYGQRDIKKMARVSGNGFSVTILASIVVGVVVLLLVLPQFDSVMITSQMGDFYNPITLDLAWRYVWPIILGAPLMFLTYYFTSLLRTEGYMLFVIVLTIVSVILNIAFSIFFIIVVEWGLGGAAFGTVLSWIFQIIVSMLFVFNKKVKSFMKFSLKDMVKIEKGNFFYFLKAGFPNFVIQMALVVVSYISTILVVKLPGQEDVQGVSVLQQLYSAISPWMNFILSVGIGLTQGARGIIAYNYGARKFNRIWQVLKRCSWLIIAWFCITLLIFITFNGQMIRMFSFPEEFVDKYRWWVVINFMTYPFSALTYISLTLFQGINRSLLGTVSSSLRTIVVLLPLSGIGFGVAVATGNPIFYYVFVGLNDLICALILMPILLSYWRKYKDKLIDHPDQFETQTIINKDFVEDTKS
ncbi:MATE family efflux transporter [Spiroplasma endosymbiont of Anurida maritima]|uniref:MATE family efflux transporter n=1 Tax=Spiroplasma endosymbiont of Anurida maritima TaxID=2967972 RepID=UPI0036D3AF77